MEVPPQLQAALNAELAAVPAHRLARATAALVERYRSARPAAGGRFIASDEDVVAYAAYRMPATYAAVFAALLELDAQWPGEPPGSLLDAGAGPGSTVWAALEVWPSLAAVTLLERDPRMIALGQRLAARAPWPAAREARWQGADLLDRWDAPAHDLVVAAYVLNELPDERRDAVVDALWARARGGLLLVEPGTPAGFAVIRRARGRLLDAGGAVLAPCPHGDECPMPSGDWCHFAQRVNRTRLQRALKGGALAYEDEKFSYVAVARQPGPPIAGRVLRHPQVRPGHIMLQLCTPEGLRQTTVTRSDREAFRQARHLRWGDAV